MAKNSTMVEVSAMMHLQQRLSVSLLEVISVKTHFYTIADKDLLTKKYVNF